MDSADDDCIFCGFVSGKKKEHRDGRIFLPLHESERTLSFLSIDFPSSVEGHALVIPKRHFERLVDVPEDALSELMVHVRLLARALEEDNEGCNVLLNDGHAAGQRVPHLHFHVVPRNEGDGIEIESWERGEVAEERYSKLTAYLREVIERLSQ